MKRVSPYSTAIILLLSALKYHARLDTVKLNLEKAMGYFIAAIVRGMLIWAGIKIVQTVRNWEPNQSEFNKKMQAEMGQYEANGFVADSAIAFIKDFS